MNGEAEPTAEKKLEQVEEIKQEPLREKAHEAQAQPSEENHPKADGVDAKEGTTGLQLTGPGTRLFLESH